MTGSESCHMRVNPWCGENRSWARTAAVAMGLGCLVLATSVAHALDLNGAWATNASACKDVFVRKGKQIRLSGNADFFGSGFVVDGQTIRGKIAVCRITSRKDEGDAISLAAACSTDIMMTAAQFNLKVVDDNKIMRVLPGNPEMDTPYYRCKF
jgi:hypothetical protein